MPSIKTQWTRLIRFVAAETSRVHIGQPVDPNLDVGLAYSQSKPIKAHEIVGSSPLDLSASLSDKVLTVKQLLTPISGEQIKVVRCLGLNYLDHAKEAKMDPPAFPTLFYKPPTSLIGPSAPVVIPTVAQPVKEHLPDYEAELVIVVGKPAKNVSEKEALDYVIGYTGANDVSFRKHQMAVTQWGFSKGFDNTNPLGPCLVAASNIPNPQNIPLSAKVNDKLLQNGSTKDHIFTVAQTVSFLSQGTTLEPGTVILTGTPAGVGFTRKPPIYLKDGDKMVIWVGNGIGSLVNDVVEEKKVQAKL